jgi:hypothetical protein
VNNIRDAKSTVLYRSQIENEPKTDKKMLSSPEDHEQKEEE